MRARFEQLKSRFDSSLTLSDSECVLTLIDSAAERASNRKGHVGFLVIEMLDENSQHNAYYVGLPFGGNKEAEIGLCPNSHIESRVNCIATYSWSIPKSHLQSDFFAQFLQKVSAGSELPYFNFFSEYSFDKAKQLLRVLNISAPNYLNDRAFVPYFVLKDKKIKWNFFARLVESKYFPFSRLQQSSFQQRLEDTFFVLNGSFLDKNELGLFDYFFPVPRLLNNLLNLEWPSGRILGLIKLLILIPTLLTDIIKIAAAAGLTILLSPIIGLINLGIYLFIGSNNNQETEDNININLINADLDDIADLDETRDLSPSQPLSSFARMHRDFSIKPLLKKADSQYESFNQPVSSETFLTLLFGLYVGDKPRAVLSINPQNKSGIRSLLEKNAYHIDEALESAHAMEQTLRML